MEFVPRRFCGWAHRWDDPQREYRTLYAAWDAETRLRDVLADLRPNAKVLAELEELFGSTGVARDAGVVRRDYRERLVLAPAFAVADGELCEIDRDVALRRQLEHELARLLVAHRMEHLDISEIRSRSRPVTQAAGRLLFERGYAGVVFGSQIDGGRCVALFEGHGRLAPRGEPVALSADLPELLRVCAELGLELET